MRTLKLKLTAILIILLGFISNCSKDEKKVSVFVGDYVITEATVAESFNIPITGVGNVPVQAGIPITTAIQTALLNAVSSCSADKTYVEMRDDFSLYMSCEGASPINAGTWSEVSATQLLLNLNSTAVPPSGISLAVTEVVKNGTILTGNSTVPMPKAFIAAIIAPATLEPSAPPIFLVKISLKFTQK